jgi:phage gpG-like protein
MSAAIKVDNKEVLLALGQFKSDATDKPALLRICGERMRTSIALTFREEGSPAGSWPALALSTLKKKGYSAGHKLLVLSGRLFGSISYLVAGSVLTIGTGISYARVQQEGSADYAAGPRSLAQHESVAQIGAHESTRVTPFRRYGKVQRLGSDGRMRTVRVRAQGQAKRTRFGVEAHTRRQNIPPRPFLVFRPEDPERMGAAVEAYLGGKAVKIGKVGHKSGSGVQA